eukprot:TRINITY_DN9617_c0_g1_i1.p1 TRINITY_DN9617_c0_g1~~TRINITY_DN9617_c0_g1_i1.p1  ORF type:complete len:219 (+),score=18.70 TRINITY_DN9617_c0_g1_i1:66-659(+)
MLSTQYAGTGALKSGFTRTGKRTTDGLIDDGLKSATRYYLNIFEDGHKQDAYDLITGSYVVDASAESGPFHPQCSAAWLMLAAFASLLVSLCLAALAPMSDKLTLLHAGEVLLAGLACYGITRALGRRGTCRPQLCFDAVKPWLAEDQRDGSKKLDQQDQLCFGFVYRLDVACYASRQANSASSCQFRIQSPCKWFE